MRRQLTLNSVAARPCFLSFRHSVKWASAARSDGRSVAHSQANLAMGADTHQGTNASSVGRAERSSPTAAQRCAEGAGLDGVGADRTTIRRAEMMSERLRRDRPSPDPFRSPGGDSLLFALRRDGRRRIGEVGAGRSHPRSRRRTESRTHQAGNLARVPPRPSLAGERYRRLRRGNGGSSKKVGAMPARLTLMPML